MVTGAVTTLSAHTLLIRGSSLVHLFGSGSLVHRLVYLLGSWPLVLHSSVCLSITALSARVVVAAPWLVCHSSFTDPSLVMAARASDRSSGVALPVALPVAFLSAVLSPVCLLVRLLVPLSSVCFPSLVCLLVRRSSICSGRGRSSVCSGRGHWLARPSGSLLFVRRWPWSSICHWYIARASARLVVGVSLVCRWCVVGVSLTCR